MKKVFCLVGCIVLVVLFLCMCGVLAYFGYKGFVPGVSSLFGANKPKDLGVTYTELDYESFMTKSASSIETIPVASVEDIPSPEESVVFSVPNEQNITYTQSEATARVNNIQWPYSPVRDTQVKFNSDGSMEVSTILVLDNLVPFLGAAGYEVTQEDVNKAFDKIGLIPVDPAFYIKAIPVISENTATITIQEFEIGRFPIDVEQYGGSEILSELVTQIFAQIDGFYARSVTIGDGTITFDGTSPTVTTVYTVEE